MMLRTESEQLEHALGGEAAAPAVEVEHRARHPQRDQARRQVVVVEVLGSDVVRGLRRDDAHLQGQQLLSVLLLLLRRYVRQRLVDKKNAVAVDKYTSQTTGVRTARSAYCFVVGLGGAHVLEHVRGELHAGELLLVFGGQELAQPQGQRRAGQHTVLRACIFCAQSVG